MGRQNRGTNAGSQDKQHFSHQHALKLIVNPTETVLNCNACEQPNNTNKHFYGCNTCQYFLHENCFNAPRFLNHSCAACDFDIHLQCASSPSSILVNNHPHQLELNFGSPYKDKNSVYICDMCNVIMSRENWLYYCAGCDLASHLHCAITYPEVGVFPKQQRPIPNPNPNPSQNSNSSWNSHANSVVEMINSVNDDHDRFMAAQIGAQIEARGRRAILDTI
nr:uncharacterized protein LOC104647908 [Solanum lycopersicum]